VIDDRGNVIGSGEGLLSEWSGVHEWDLELTCNTTYHADVTNTSGTRVIGSESETSHYHLLAKLEQTSGNTWSGSGDASASAIETWKAEDLVAGFTQRGNYEVRGQGNGEELATLRIGSLLRDDQSPLPVYFLEVSPITIPVALSSYMYTYSGIPADEPSETSNQSSGTREVSVPRVADWPVPPFEEQHLHGSQQVPFGRGTTQLTWSLRPASDQGLRGLTVIAGASQEHVTGVNSWATTRLQGRYVVVEAKTGPKNDASEWKKIKWSGAGAPVPNHPNRRRLPRDQSAKLTVTANLNNTSRSIDIWVVSADVSVLTSGTRPRNAAPFDTGLRDGTDKLGAVTYDVGVFLPIAPGEVVQVMLAAGKVIPVAKLSPRGVETVVKSGWAIEREVKCHDWRDGFKVESTKAWQDGWTRDTSGPAYLRLQPDDAGQIYDLDAPAVLYGDASFETYNNFRQWVEWNGERCSDYVTWHWWARWHLTKPKERQIELQDLGAGGPTRALPRRPVYPKK
jgi:hypothetical protein